MSFSLFTSNRLEILVEDLSQTLAEPLPSPFEPEIIVIQSRGMERWLAMELARRQGICANVRFPFPNSFVREIFQRLNIQPPKGDASAHRPDIERAYDPDILPWKIMRLLPECLEESSFARLKSYLSDPGGELKRLQLAKRLADLFDQYLLFRPEMILRWERGEESHWQAQLWRKIHTETSTLHRAALGNALTRLLDHGDVARVDLPSRISVFGISALPEFHMHVLVAVSKVSDVRLFLMNPCREYWGDILSESEIRRAARKQQKRPSTLELFHFEQGNSLLASLGKLGRDFFDLIEEKFEYEAYDRFEEPRDDSLLTSLQSEILNLHERHLQGDPKKRVKPADRSVQIHACHSPSREIEVLQNQLLNLFESDPTLKPGDVLIMAPNIEPYVPYIQAVFDLPQAHANRIPFSIADRSFDQENSVIEVFFSLLDLPGSRANASHILAILEAPAVSKRFAISEEDLELIQHWIRKTRIRWGKDSAARGELGLPELPQNTWRAGLDRLLLGYALPGRDDMLYDETILPYDRVEGSQATALGKLVEFMEQLFAKIESLVQDRTLQEWKSELNDLIDHFIEPEDSKMSEVQVLRSAVAEFDELQELSGFEEKVGLRVIRHHLESKLKQEGFGYGFLSGGITFCSMLPMRSIPAKVLCLIGMNHDAYPRQAKQLGFDLIAQNSRRGDRSRRNDDRYLFLEALLSARQVLYISYVGQSIKDGGSIPASVVVEEVLDYIEGNFETDDASILDRLVTKHRLQAFSPEYFNKEGRLFSYSEENLQVARNLLLTRSEPATFISEDPLPEPEAGFKTVSLMDLYRFFRNPAQFLFNKRLNLYLRDEADVTLDEEAFSLGGLDRYDIAEALVHEKIAGKDAMHLKDARMAAGQLPHGSVGEYQYESLNETVEHFAEKTRNYVLDQELEPLQIDIKLDKFQVVGKIDNINRRRLTRYRFARVRAKDHLWVWIQHLALNIVNQAGYPATSFLAGVDSMKEGNWLGWTLEPISNGEEVLSELLRIYWDGLTRPIRFFPDSALGFVQYLRAGRPVDSALWRARRTWEGGNMERGENEDLYLMRCFGTEANPLDESFQELAQQVWTPILDHEQEITC